MYKGAYKFGFSKPIIAKYSEDNSTGEVTYSDAFQCGEGVSTTITPSYANAKLYGDNRCVEDINEFVSAAVSLGVTRLPLKAAEVLFGHKIDDTLNTTETSNANDSANFVGYGFAAKNSDGTFDACVLLKCKFAEGEDSYATKGESITFTQPTLSGSALALANGDWRKKKFGFTSEENAVAWIYETLGLSAPSAE
ncbi:MAG: hypothetical protein KBT03_06095 [Bacteroidales bacterium]|nr:hypothetical protein [Candidatus Scybalousia scybalohippi]